METLTFPKLLFIAAIGSSVARAINKYTRFRVPVELCDNFSTLLWILFGAGFAVMALLSIFVAYSEWLFYPHKSFLFSIVNFWVATLRAITMHALNVPYAQ